MSKDVRNFTLQVRLRVEKILISKYTLCMSEANIYNENDERLNIIVRNLTRSLESLTEVEIQIL